MSEQNLLFSIVSIYMKFCIVNCGLQASMFVMGTFLTVIIITKVKYITVSVSGEV